MKEKFDHQLKEAEDSERAALRRYTSCRQELAETGAELSTLRGQLEHSNERIKDLEAGYHRLQSERGQVKEVIKLEFQDALSQSEASLDTLARNLKESKANHRTELAEQQEKYDKQIADIHDKVRSTMARKDEALARLRQELTASRTRSDHLDELIKQQQDQILNA
jgi:chromosome segregation ATPase